MKTAFSANTGNRNFAKIFGAAMALAIFSFTSIVEAGGTRRTTVDWVDVSEAEDLVRVKVADGIMTPAPCQEKIYMVFRLSNPHAKTYLAAIYMAAADQGALVRLYGSDQCDLEAGAETITRVRLVPSPSN